MQDTPNYFDTSMLGLKKDAWLEELALITEIHGFYQTLGPRHLSTFIDEKDSLLVTFETIQGIQTYSERGQPLGFDFVRDQGWSHLALISDGDTWFRDRNVYGYFDQLIDDGFFEEFEQVVFYGAGPCAYAAAAFSVAAPGATVLTVQPQATLDPRVTEWDDRFLEMRKTSFTDRYGYAPEMLDAAAQAFVIYDPRQDIDAMHAALFTRPNVTKFRMPNMGTTLQADLLRMNILHGLLKQAMDGTLDDLSFAQAYRTRRTYPRYLRGLMARFDAEERFAFTRMLCENVTSRMQAPRFRRRLDQLNATIEDASDEDPGVSPSDPK